MRHNLNTFKLCRLPQADLKALFMPLNPRPTFINSSAHEILQASKTHLSNIKNKNLQVLVFIRILADDYPKSQQEVMTSCHLYSETRIYCEFRENKSQAANWSKAKPFQMASLRGFWNAVTKIYSFLLLYNTKHFLNIT